MARTFIRQSTQIASSDVYLDDIAPDESTYETLPEDIEQNLNHLRSQIQSLINRDGETFSNGKWWNDITAPNTFENGSKRGVSALNRDLHSLERKRVLTSFVSLADVTVPSGQNYVVLSDVQLPNPSNIGQAVAIGSTDLTGSVAAYNATFGSHALDEVPGATAISPKNLCMVVTGSNRDPLLSTGSIVYALFQVENNTNGHTMNGTDKRAQLSFVKVNDTGDDLVACPAADIQNLVINYVSSVRKALGDLNEQDFLRGAEIDVPSTSASSRKNGYDNQGSVPVVLSNNASLDINSTYFWEIADSSSNPLFKVTEGAVAGNSTVQLASDVDYFDVNAVDVDFNGGVKFSTGGTRIDVGVTAGTVETTATDDLKLKGAGEIYLNDGNKPVSWSVSSGVKLSDTATEWANFESAFGEVSLLKAAYQSRRRDKVYAEVLGNVAANTNVSGGLGAGANLKNSVVLPYMNSGSFVKDYDIYLNGQLLNPGANSGTDNDYYPGIDEYSLKFEFPLKDGDIICVVPYVRD